MAGMEAEIERVLQAPTEVRVSLSDETVKLFYEFYGETSVGGGSWWGLVEHGY